MHGSSGDTKSDESLLHDFNLLLSHIFSGGTMAEWEGRSPEAIKIIHYNAIKLYNSGNYDDAHILFHELVRLNHSNYEFMFSLAACLQKKKRYANAANVYLSSIMLNEGDTNLEPSFRIAECLIASNSHLDEAERYLEHVIKHCPDEGELSEFGPIAKAKLKLLKKKGAQKEKNKQN